MSFSSGTYSLPGPALNTGDTVSATENNAFRNDVATAFNLTWLRNGTAAATADIPMGGFSFTNCAAVGSNGSLLLKSNNGTTAVTIDTAQNVGVGVTPSAWTTSRTAIQMSAGSVYQESSTDIGFAGNAYRASGGWTYQNTGTAAMLARVSSGAFQWYTAPSGTAGNAISFTQAMTLDASGNLLVGGTTQYGGAKLTLSNAGAYLALNSTSGGYSLIRGFDSGTGRWSIGQIGFGGTDGMAFYTGSSDTERARIDSSGNLLVGKTAADTTNAGVWLYNAGPGQGRINVVKSATGTANSIANYYNGTYVGGLDYSNTATLLVASSDERLKQNIVTAPTALNKVNAIEVVSYDWKHDPSHVEFGFVAQKLNTVYPEAVIEGDNGEEITKTWGVEYGRLTPLLVKAIQEQQTQISDQLAIIESLTARITALEAA